VKNGERASKTCSKPTVYWCAPDFF